jgi:hypothetical protein
MRLFDTTLAVSRTRTLRDFCLRALDHGLELIELEDLSERVRPNAERPARVARRFFRRTGFARLSTTLLPSLLVRNAVAGVLTPSLLGTAYG